MPDIHAENFSASSSVKFLNCPGSVTLEKQFPNKETDSTKEGTLAHSIAELKLRKKFTEPMPQRTFNTRMNKLKKDPVYQEEMQGYTDVYVEYIEEKALSFDKTPFVAVEKRVMYDNYAPGGFGTSDCILICNDTLCVIDFKYGKGVPVSAEFNSQGMLYALGAINAYSMLFPIKTVVIAIVQPRLDSISEFVISREDLEKWGDEVVKPACQKILNGDTECKPGYWCDKGFCRARPLCRKQTKEYTALDDFGEALPPLLSDKEVGQILKKAQGLKKWVSKLEEYALAAILAGKEIPGWKAVEGRSNRTFTDTDKAIDHLVKNGFEKDLLYERKPLSLTAMEKTVGKSDFAKLMADYIVKPKGKPTLAEADDKREEYKQQDAVNDFTDVIKENGGN